LPSSSSCSEMKSVDGPTTRMGARNMGSPCFRFLRVHGAKKRNNFAYLC
jgi:hypothetical protein